MLTVAFTGVPATSTLGVLELVTDALRDGVRLVGARMGQQAAELLAADAEQEIGRADIAVHHGDEPHQHVVAAGMPQPVVQRLEVVEVEEQAGTSGARSWLWRCTRRAPRATNARRLSAPVNGSVCAFMRWSSSRRSLDIATSSTLSMSV